MPILCRVKVEILWFALILVVTSVPAVSSETIHTDCFDEASGSFGNTGELSETDIFSESLPEFRAADELNNGGLSGRVEEIGITIAENNDSASSANEATQKANTGNSTSAPSLTSGNKVKCPSKADASYNSIRDQLKKIDETLDSLDHKFLALHEWNNKYCLSFAKAQINARLSNRLVVPLGKRKLLVPIPKSDIEKIGPYDPRFASAITKKNEMEVTRDLIYSALAEREKLVASLKGKNVPEIPKKNLTAKDKNRIAVKYLSRQARDNLERYNRRIRDLEALVKKRTWALGKIYRDGIPKNHPTLKKLKPELDELKVLKSKRDQIDKNIELLGNAPTKAELEHQKYLKNYRKTRAHPLDRIKAKNLHKTNGAGMSLNPANPTDTKKQTTPYYCYE